MAEHRFDPDAYLWPEGQEPPEAGELRDAVAEAAAGLDARDVLDLGTGAGLTAERLLRLYPEADLTGVDADPYLLAVARARLGHGPELVVAPLEDPLPPGPFDLVVSAPAPRRLDAAVARVLRPGGRFVTGEAVPEDGVEARLAQLAAAGFDARLVRALSGWAVFAATRT